MRIIESEKKLADIRQHLGAAADHKRRADAAEKVRAYIRLRSPLAVQPSPDGGRLGWLKWRNKGKDGATEDGYQFQQLTDAETSAVYQALAIVIDDNRRLARENEEAAVTR